MEFKIKPTPNPNLDNYHQNDLALARKFSKQIFQEFGEFLRAVVIFGSAARRKDDSQDIDILIIIDDTRIQMTQEIVEAYRIITEKAIAETSMKLHVMTLKLTTFWDYIRNGDPVGINILRDGFALIDTGFFEPLQILLRMGRIRPTYESIFTYFQRAPLTLRNSKWHIMQATLDLYWAVIDAAHAALMKIGEIPPTPEHVGDMLEKKLVNKKIIQKKYATTMRNFYKIMKMITHREIKEITGKEYDNYYIQAKDFVERMRRFVDIK